MENANGLTMRQQVERHAKAAEGKTQYFCPSPKRDEPSRRTEPLSR